MTLIDKAEALAVLRKHANGKTVLGGQVYQSLTLETALEAIAALPARGVGVLDKTLIAKKANDVREVFSGTCDTAKQAIDYLEQLILAAIATEADNDRQA